MVDIGPMGRIGPGGAYAGQLLGGRLLGRALQRGVDFAIDGALVGGYLGHRQEKDHNDGQTESTQGSVRGQKVKAKKPTEPDASSSDEAMRRAALKETRLRTQESRAKAAEYKAAAEQMQAESILVRAKTPSSETGLTRRIGRPAGKTEEIRDFQDLRPGAEEKAAKSPYKYDPKELF